MQIGDSATGREKGAIVYSQLLPFQPPATTRDRAFPSALSSSKVRERDLWANAAPEFHRRDRQLAGSSWISRPGFNVWATTAGRSRRTIYRRADPAGLDQLSTLKTSASTDSAGGKEEEKGGREIYFAFCCFAGSARILDTAGFLSAATRKLSYGEVTAAFCRYPWECSAPVTKFRTKSATGLDLNGRRRRTLTRFEQMISKVKKFRIPRLGEVVQFTFRSFGKKITRPASEMSLGASLPRHCDSKRYPENRRNDPRGQLPASHSHGSARVWQKGECK